MHIRSRVLLSSFFILHALACSSVVGVDDSVEGAASSLITRVEAEAQTFLVSAGDSVSPSSSTMRLNANALSDSFEFTRSIAAGVYDVSVVYAQRNLYGDYSVEINGVIVGTLPGYSSSSGDAWKRVTFTGVKVTDVARVRLVVAGRNAAATDYDLKLDYFEFAATSGSSGAPTGTGAGGATSAGSGAGASAGGATTPASSAGSNSGSSAGVIPMQIPTATSTEIRSSPTVLSAGVHDYQNKRIGVKNPVGCDGEGQPAVFELADGATLKNVIIAGGSNGGNGIVCKGNCTLEYVYWEDVCEDAATNSKDGATMRISHVIAKNASDKVFQHNAKAGSKTIITDSYLSTFGKVWRSCGDCTNNGGPRYLELDNVRVEGVGSTVAGANENFGDSVKIRNLFVKGGYNASDDKPKICQVFRGVQKGSGESVKLYGGASQWNSSTCNVSKTDIRAW